MPKSMLKQLYDGEIFPVESICPKNHAYREAHHQMDQILANLRDVLSAQELVQLEKLEERYFQTSSLYGYENFAYGFRLGMSLREQGMFQIPPPIP